MGFIIAGEIILIGLLKKTPLVSSFTGGTIILYGKHSVPGRTTLRRRKLIIRVAMRTWAMAPTSRSLKQQVFSTKVAIARVLPIKGFCKFATMGTNKNIFRVSSVFRKQKSGEEIDFFVAVMAGLNFHPKEILYVGPC